MAMARVWWWNWSALVAGSWRVRGGFVAGLNELLDEISELPPVPPTFYVLKGEA